MDHPDVEHHDSCAAFTVGGEKVDCYLVFLTDSVFDPGIPEGIVDYLKTGSAEIF